MKSRVILLLSFLLATLVTVMVLGSLSCDRGAITLENMVWVRQFGTSEDDYAHTIVADELGNIYVAGFVSGTLPGQASSGSSDAYIAKYDASGNMVWTRQFGTSDYDFVLAMAADGSGNIYMAGETNGTFPGQTSSGQPDAFIAKYDTSGDEVWRRQFGVSGTDLANAMVADGSGNIYVAGYTEGTFPGQTSSGNGNAFVARYDTLGNLVWTRQFDTLVGDGVKAMVADGSGNIYVAGYTMGTPPDLSGFGDVFIARYDNLGNQVWIRQVGTNGTDMAGAMVADGLGNIYVVGNTGATMIEDTLITSGGAFIARYDTLGNEVWMREFDTSGDVYAGALTVDESGNIYVAGDTNGTFPGQTSSGGPDAFIAKYDTSWNEVWTRQFGTRGAEGVKAMISDGSGNIYLAGYILGTSFPGQTPSGRYDAFIMKIVE